MFPVAFKQDNWRENAEIISCHVGHTRTSTSVHSMGKAYWLK